MRASLYWSAVQQMFLNVTNLSAALGRSSWAGQIGKHNIVWYSKLFELHYNYWSSVQQMFLNVINLSAALYRGSWAGQLDKHKIVWYSTLFQLHYMKRYPADVFNVNDYSWQSLDPEFVNSMTVSQTNTAL